MENRNFKCSGDCLKCNPMQRQYCAAQFSYNTMRMMEYMQGTMEEMKTKIEAIQGNEATLFDPTNNDDTAQGGDGVI